MRIVGVVVYYLFQSSFYRMLIRCLNYVFQSLTNIANYFTRHLLVANELNSDDFQFFSCYANQKQASDCNQLSYCTLQAVLLFYFCLISPWFNSWFTCGFTQIVITEKVLMYINICFYCLTTTYVLVALSRTA